MRFLTSSVFLFFICSTLFAQANPFNIDLNLEKHLDEEGEKQTLKITVVSSSKNKERYYSVIEIPSSSIRNLTGKNTYTGEIQPLDSDNFFIDIEALQEGRGKIKAQVYKYVDGKDIDSASVVLRSFDYSITKDDNDKYLIYVSKDASSEVPSAGIIDTETTVEDQSTKIIVNDQNRNNNLLRYILFILSFFVIGHLIYKIVKED